MSPVKPTSLVLIIAEDDEDDYVLASEAFADAGIKNEICWVKNGEELLNYLRTNLKEKESSRKRIGLILLDLNMPKKNGFESLKEIKADPNFRQIPTIILTTSKNDADISRAYELGANSFIQKPSKFSEYLKIIDMLRQYWFQVVKLPH